jgi:hypothetical protein
MKAWVIVIRLPGHPNKQRVLSLKKINFMKKLNSVAHNKQQISFKKYKTRED